MLAHPCYHSKLYKSTLTHTENEKGGPLLKRGGALQKREGGCAEKNRGSKVHLT